MDLAVIDAPSGPPGWEESRAHLIRIVDPLGRAVAWFAPEYGGMCAGFAVRSSGQRGGRWTHLFHSTAPRQSLPAYAEGGCVVHCAVVYCTLADDAPQPMQRWHYIARDPTALVMETMIPTDAEERRSGSEAGLQLRLTAHLDDATLVLDLDAWNQGVRAISPHLAFHISFARDLFGSAGASMQCDAAMTECAQKQPAIPDSHMFTLQLHDPPLAVIAEPAGDTRVTFAMTPGTSSDRQMHRSLHEERTRTLFASAAPAHGIPLEVGARSRLGIALRTIPRDDRR